MPQRQLTVKQRAWIEAMLTGVTPTEAARIAKYPAKGAKQQGHINMTKPYLMAEIEQRRAELKAETGMTVERMHAQYDEDRAFARKVRSAGAAVSASVSTARLYGMDKDADAGATKEQEQLEEHKKAESVRLTNIRLAQIGESA